MDQDRLALLRSRRRNLRIGGSIAAGTLSLAVGICLYAACDGGLVPGLIGGVLVALFFFGLGVMLEA